jgi:transposase-like protein
LTVCSDSKAVVQPPEAGKLPAASVIRLTSQAAQRGAIVDLDLNYPDLVDVAPRQNMQYSAATMRNAVRLVRESGKSVYRAARISRVPESTLRAWVKRPDCLINPPRVGRPTHLEPRDEQRLAWYLLECEACFAGLTVDVASQLVKSILEERNKLRKAMGEDPVFFDTETGLPGHAWWQSFLSRHPDLSFRHPSRHNAAQIAAGKASAIKQYIANVQKRVGNILPKNWINVDELDLRQTQVKKKIIGRRGDKSANAYKPGGYSDHVTLVSAICGDGRALPPFWIFKGKTPCSPELARGVDTPGVGLATTGRICMHAGLVSVILCIGRVRLDDCQSVVRIPDLATSPAGPRSWTVCGVCGSACQPLLTACSGAGQGVWLHYHRIPA